MASVNDSLLGQHTHYVDQYDTSLLFGIERSEARQTIGITDKLPFVGVDIWNAYELSWLNAKGKPMVAMAVLEVPCDSPRLVESKSLKLYLNSFANTPFNNAEKVVATIKQDLSALVGADVSVYLQGVNSECLALPVDAICIDELDVSVDCYEVEPRLLTASQETKTEILYSHLLRSRCPVTGQPDWATILVSYKGNAIDREGLLRYLVSFRNHQGFHELVVEQIYGDIQQQCQPQELSVYGRFTRRGGIDINPWRSSHQPHAKNWRIVRQ